MLVPLLAFILFATCFVLPISAKKPFLPLELPTLSLTIHGKSCGSAMYPLKILSEAGSAAEAAIAVVLQRKDGEEKVRSVRYVIIS